MTYNKFSLEFLTELIVSVLCPLRKLIWLQKASILFLINSYIDRLWHDLKGRASCLGVQPVQQSRIPVSEGPCTWYNPLLGLILFCATMLIFSQGAQYFPFALGPTNYVTDPAERTTKWNDLWELTWWIWMPCRVAHDDLGLNWPVDWTCGPVGQETAWR